MNAKERKKLEQVIASIKCMVSTEDRKIDVYRAIDGCDALPYREAIGNKNGLLNVLAMIEGLL